MRSNTKLRPRVIPCLQLRDDVLVKSVRFKEYHYIGDPINTVRIFNELEVDELLLLDVFASKRGAEPNYGILAEIANECFMPLSYGGGVRSVEQVRRILSIGYEKVVVNTSALETPDLITRIANQFGSQCVIASIDVAKTGFLKTYKVYCHATGSAVPKAPDEWALQLEAAGAGELLLTSVDRDGTWSGYDVELMAKVSSRLRIPLIANGGAGNVGHIGDAVKTGGASAVGVGSMVVYQGNGLGVLVNFPNKADLDSTLSNG